MMSMIVIGQLKSFINTNRLKVLIYTHIDLMLFILNNYLN